MKYSSDAEELHSLVVLLKMRAKNTEELVSIWTQNDRKFWKDDEIDAARLILVERIGKLPEQKKNIEDDRIANRTKPAADAYTTFTERVWDFGPITKFKVILLAIILGALLLGAMLDGIVSQNTESYWKFLKQVAAGDIVRIQIQPTDSFQNTVDNPITITDRGMIVDFVTAIGTVEQYSANHPDRQKDAIVKVWLTNGQTIEFECYTLPGEGNTLFVGYVWIKPNFYSFGNGDARFPAPTFYDWLLMPG